MADIILLFMDVYNNSILATTYRSMSHMITLIFMEDKHDTEVSCLEIEDGIGISNDRDIELKRKI